MVFFAMNKILGFGEKILIARYFGASAESDALIMAQNLFIAGWLILEDVLAPALIPTLQYIRRTGGRSDSDGSFTVLILLISLPLSLVFLATPLLFPDWTASILYPRLPMETRLLLSDLWKYFLIGGIPYFLTPILQAYANSRKRFLIPAMSQVLGRFSMLLCFLVFVQNLGISAGGWGVIAYGSIHCILIIALLRIPWKMDSAKWGEAGKYLGCFSYLALPLVLGQAFSQATQWVDINLASGMSAGALSTLSYARKLSEVPILLGAFALGVVMFPYLSDFHERNQHADFRKYFFRCFWLCAGVYSILGMANIYFGTDLVRLIYAGGRFTEGTVESVSALVRLFGLGLPVFALEIMVMQASFAIRYHWHAVFIGMACACLNMGFTLWLFPRFGIMVIPIALIAQKALKTSILGLLLLGKLKSIEKGNRQNPIPSFAGG